MLICGKTNRVARFVMWRRNQAAREPEFVWMRYKNPRAILHDGHACVNVHVCVCARVSLHLHTSLSCIGMWLMTFINGSEQGLGPLQCCLLSPLLSSNDFLPISFPQGWPCHSSGLQFCLSLPSSVTRSLQHPHNFLNSHLRLRRRTQALRIHFQRGSI